MAFLNIKMYSPKSITCLYFSILVTVMHETEIIMSVICLTLLSCIDDNKLRVIYLSIIISVDY